MPTFSRPGGRRTRIFSFGAHDDYPLLALQSLLWYVTRTNDLAYAREVYPKYAQLLHGMDEHRDANGFTKTRCGPLSSGRLSTKAHRR